MHDYEDRLEKSWVDNAQGWAHSVREGKIESRKLVTDQAIVYEIMKYRPKKVLDVGCGEGWLARELSQQGIEVDGIDGSLELIAMAQAAGYGSFHQMNYDQLCQDTSCLGGAYDVIVCNFSILSEEIHSLLQSLSHLLCSDGVLMIQTLHPFLIAQNDRYTDGWRQETFSGMGEGYKAEMPWYFRTIGSWVQELHTAGFQLRSCKEPLHPIKGVPLSLLLVANRVTI